MALSGVKMNIKTIASSSAGCCYIIESNGKHLIIDIGVPLKRIREALNHDLSSVVGCLISHSHGDHCKYAKQLEKETSVPIWCTTGTGIGCELKLAKIITGNKIKVGNFQILPVKLFHDVENFGFLIQDGSDSLFYATDTVKVPYTFPELKKVMIEANHSFELMLQSGMHKSVVERTAETHLDIDRAIDFIKRHPDLEEIHLLHLSSSHSDAGLFKKMAQDASGVPVYVAGE